MSLAILLLLITFDLHPSVVLPFDDPSMITMVSFKLVEMQAKSQDGTYVQITLNKMGSGTRYLLVEKG